MRRGKYNAVRTNGYASRKEANRAAELAILEKVGAIKALREQVSFELLPANPAIGYARPLRYIADFVFLEGHPDGTWPQVVEDTKGMKTAVYLLKKRLMAQLLGITIREV